ncbi:MAG: flavin reductase family protein [Proteobacteria bacterium]|nr:flavin reductase family protein [Pseudomonadota bacterium]
MKVEKLIEMNAFDTRDFRTALGSFATGVTIVTARDVDGALAGLTINSFASVSLDPPLVLWSLSLYTPALAVFERCSHYAVNVLAADQTDLSILFAKPSDDGHENRFANLEFDSGSGGAPLLRGCCARFECRNETRHAGGDHLIFVGRVERYRYQDSSPLVFQGGQYRRLAIPE